MPLFVEAGIFTLVFLAIAALLFWATSALIGFSDRRGWPIWACALLAITPFVLAIYVAVLIDMTAA